MKMKCPSLAPLRHHKAVLKLEDLLPNSLQALGDSQEVQTYCISLFPPSLKAPEQDSQEKEWACGVSRL